MSGYPEWRHMWDHSGPWHPTVDDITVLLTEIDRARPVVDAAARETQAETDPRSISRLERPAVTIEHERRARRAAVRAYQETAR